MNDFTMTERLLDDSRHTGHSDRGRGRMKEIHSILHLAGVRSLSSATMHGLCFWTAAMLKHDARTIVGEDRLNSVMNMRNLLWLMLRESPAVCMQHLKQQTALARAVGHNKSLPKTRARFNYLWRSDFTKIMLQRHLLPGDFEHRRRPIELIGGYDAPVNLSDADQRRERPPADQAPYTCGRRSRTDSCVVAAACWRTACLQAASTSESPR
jgi:hypothetical protein